jgi:hypothetical protein
MPKLPNKSVQRPQNADQTLTEAKGKARGPPCKKKMQRSSGRRSSISICVVVDNQDPSGLHLPAQSGNGLLWIRGMLNNADANDHVKLFRRERKFKDVRLTDEIIREGTAVLVVCLDRR